MTNADPAPHPDPQLRPALRTAQAADIPALKALIAQSGIALSAGFYTPAQAAALTQHVFGVDSQLIADQSYFVIEHEGGIVACGGWSRRRTLFGGDQAKKGPDPELDPQTEAARIRAFFVAPAMARRGLGRQLLDHCASQAQKSGFVMLELAATLPGVPLYSAAGFSVIERFEIALPDAVQVPLVRMQRKSMLQTSSGSTIPQ